MSLIHALYHRWRGRAHLRCNLCHALIQHVEVR